MKITVFGATGLIGSKVVDLLNHAGHDVVAASRASADVLTGDGLADALTGADVLVDMTNSPSFDDGPVMDFFSRSSAKLVAAAKETGVGHYVALSIVGVDGLPESGYMRAKVVQEKTIAESGLPYTIVRATQFQEFAVGIVGSLDAGDVVRVPDALIQPIAADDVAAEVARVAVAVPAQRCRQHRWAGEDLVRRPRPQRVGQAGHPTRPSSSTRRPPTSAPRSAETSLVTGDGAVLGTVRLAAHADPSEFD